MFSSSSLNLLHLYFKISNNQKYLTKKTLCKLNTAKLFGKDENKRWRECCWVCVILINLTLISLFVHLAPGLVHFYAIFRKTARWHQLAAPYICIRYPVHLSVRTIAMDSPQLFFFARVQITAECFKEPFYQRLGPQISACCDTDTKSQNNYEGVWCAGRFVDVFDASRLKW